MNLLDKPFVLLDDSPGKNKINFGEWILKYLYLWPWIILSLLACFSLALVYITFTPSKYIISAKVYIKDQKDQPESQVALKELELFRDKKTIENEIEVLKSMQLTRKVVKDLNLNISYSLKGFSAHSGLYDTIPFLFVPVKIHADDATMSIEIKDEKSFILDPGKSDKEISFGKLQKNKIGNWIIVPTSNLKNFIGKTIEISYADPENASMSYLDRLDVNQTSKLSSIAELTIKDMIPARGKDFLNSLIKNYDLDSKNEKNKIASGALKFIDNRLSSLSLELADAERNIEGFRSINHLTNISAESSLFLNQVEENDNKLNEVNVQLKILEQIEGYINSNATGNAPATVGISDPTLIDLIKSLNEVQIKKEHLLATNFEANPLLDPLDRQIRSTKLSIREVIANIRSSLNAARKQLNTYNSGFESSIQRIPSQERHLVDIQRKQSVKENLYVYLMQKREEVALSFASTLPENRVIDSAFYTKPYWPKKGLIYFGAFALGLLIPAGFLMGKSYLFPRITSRTEIEHHIDAPIIGELMQQAGNPIFVLDDRRNLALAEQFRSLRTNLKLVHGSEQGRVTLLTSSIGSEGKSFICSNLALALAVSGRKTVILELDLRKPKITGMFNLSPEHPGISDYLKGEAAFENIIQPSNKAPLLDIIGAGQYIDNPSELLEETALDQLIDNLKSSYDDIILDSPPVHLVTDAVIISRVADVTIYLIRQGITSKSELHFIGQLYIENKLPKMNILFNGIERKKHGYGYNYDKSYYGNRNLRVNKGNYTLKMPHYDSHSK